MRAAVTGHRTVVSAEAEAVLEKFESRIGQTRFPHDLLTLAVAASGLTLQEAGISFPAGRADIGLFMGIDGSIEDIKDDYCSSIVKEGVMGASPLLFPFTSPNAVLSLISIAFDIRGESITIPVQYSCADVIKYAAECVTACNVAAALAGGIVLNKKSSTASEGRYSAEFYFIEGIGSALDRGAAILKTLQV